MHSTKELKVPLSCRIPPVLKQNLEEEAVLHNMTTSAYLVSILENRKKLPDTVDQNEVIQLKQRIEELEYDSEELTLALKYIQEYQQEIRTFKEENKKLLEQVDIQKLELLNLKEKVLWNFSEIQEETFDKLLTSIKDGYPGISNEQLLLACLQAMNKNESSFWFIHTIEGSLDELQSEEE